MNNISQKIKGLLEISGKSQKELSEYMGISFQALRNKLARGSFSASDLIKIASFTDSDLAFLHNEHKIILDDACLRDSD